MKNWDSLNLFHHYVLQIADNTLILGQQLCEWCGHGSILEQDIALSNIALDLLGQSRLYYQYLSESTGGKFKEDDFLMYRDARKYRNSLLVEMPNGNWGTTITRQFLFDQFHILLLQKLSESSDQRLAEIAVKSIKEVKYHQRFSAEWVIRLGDGTQESHSIMQESVDELYKYSCDFFVSTEADQYAASNGICASPIEVEQLYYTNVNSILQEATLKIPEIKKPIYSGKKGYHTEKLGYILAELQYMENMYPNCEW